MSKLTPARKSPPSDKKISEYWINEKCETEIGIDWSECCDRCWRCAKESQGGIEKCHIIPHSLGGSNEPSNYVLLCKRCHREAPNVNDKEGMWDWISATSTSFYGTFFDIRAKLMFFDIYGRMPFSGEDFKKYNIIEVMDLEKLHLEKFLESNEISTHFGENLNESSLAIAYARAEESAIGKRPKARRRSIERRFQQQVITDSRALVEISTKDLEEYIKQKTNG